MKVITRIIISLTAVLLTAVTFAFNFSSSAYAEEWVDNKTNEAYAITPMATVNITTNDIYAYLVDWIPWMSSSLHNLINSRADGIMGKTNEVDAYLEEWLPWMSTTIKDTVINQSNSTVSSINDLINVGNQWQKGQTQTINDAQTTQILGAIAALEGMSGGDGEGVAQISTLLYGVAGVNCAGKETLGDKLKCFITREFQQSENDRLIREMQENGENTRQELEDLKRALEDKDAKDAERHSKELEKLEQQRNEAQQAAQEAQADADAQRAATENAANQAHTDSQAEQSKLDGISGQLEQINQGPGNAGISGIDGLAGGYSQQLQAKVDTWTAPLECVTNSITTGTCGGGPTIQLGDWYTWKPLDSGCELLPTNEIGLVRQLLGVGVVLSALFVCISMILGVLGIQFGSARSAGE